MKPILVVRIPDVGEVRFDGDARTFRPVPGSADRSFERLILVEKAISRGSRTLARDAQVEVLVRAFPGSTVGVLTDEIPEAPETLSDARWRSRWGSQLPNATSE